MAPFDLADVTPREQPSAIAEALTVSELPALPGNASKLQYTRPE